MATAGRFAASSEELGKCTYRTGKYKCDVINEN
jgi:hypothetical protein